MKSITDKIKELELQVELLKKRISLLEDMLKEYLPLSINKLLEMRGFNVIRKEDNLDLIEKKEQELLYVSLKSYYFRRVLRDILFVKKIGAEEKELIEEKWGKITENYIDKIEVLGIVKKERDTLVAQIPLGYTGTILEWFIGKYLKEELGLETILDVKLKNLESGGDIDILSRIGTNLIAIECKESPPNNVPVSELKSITNRVNFIKPDVFILLIDTTLSIKKNILDNLMWITKTKSKRLKEGVYTFGAGKFVVTAKRDLLQNIAFCISEGTNGIR